MWKISVLWPSYQGRLINLQMVLLVSAEMLKLAGWLDLSLMSDTPITIAMYCNVIHLMKHIAINVMQYM